MAGVDLGILNLTIFVLAVFAGSYAVSNPPSVSYASLTVMNGVLSGTVVVGALIAAGAGQFSFSAIIGFLAVILGTVSVVGGFLLVQRMLRVFEEQ